MKLKNLIIAGLLLIAVCFAVIIVTGKTYTVEAPFDASSKSAEDYRVEIEKSRGRDILELKDKKVEDGRLYMTVCSIDRGRTFIEVYESDEAIYMDVIYVHAFGIITFNNFFGKCTGGWMITWAAVIFLIMILWSVVIRYRSGMRRSLYQYRNIRNLGWIIFISMMLLGQLPSLFTRSSFIEAVKMTMGSASFGPVIAFPLAFIVSILVTASNIRLMRREGFTWRNMLGAMLGVLVCAGTVLPQVISAILQRTTVVDVHNEQGAAMYIEQAATNSMFVIVLYLECILLGTVILSIKAARRVPSFDKDHILILGCQIGKDGGLLPLIKGRADRALEFARMQKEQTGRDIIFVPSGGQGPDEVIAEAEAVRNYLLEQGIPEERIITEASSKNTYENFRNSIELIKEHSAGDVKEDGPAIAFSTTNYHVFRSGILAEEQGIPVEGIGSRTRSYFWINAFVREFIATVYSERKKHAVIIAVMVAAILGMLGIVFLSNIL